ncbi:MAG: hypothetical protein EA378_10625 [Phycisphaerales bacterium]|nr:MAG: hypothetical protein EA378_10625 [Phycisphaerales bacterium]
MSFLEVVAATTLLALLAATLSAALGAVRGGEARARSQLAAAELAHRLIVMHLDDPESMPSQNLPIDYDGRLYNWRLQQQPIALIPLGEEEPGARSAIDRFRRLIVTVWLSPDSGGNPSPDTPGSGAVTLTRIYDQLPMRNPDSIRGFIGDGDAESIRRLLEVISPAPSNGRR